MKDRLGWKQIIAAAAVTGAFGLWHFLDVRAGAAASGDGWLTGWYLCLWALALCAAVIFGRMFLGRIRGRQWSLERIYPAAALGLGLMYMFVFPPLSAPDEISHYITAYEVSSHILGQPARRADGRVLVRAQDWILEDVYGDYEIRYDGVYWARDDEAFERDSASAGVVLGQKLDESTYRVIHDIWTGDMPAQESRGTGPLVVTSYPPVTTTPAAYLPQAIGIAAARLLRLNSLWLAYLGRFCNLLFFTVMTWLALKRLPFGKEVLFGTALLPMTVHLSASFSYDVMILACMFLLTAVCLDLTYARDRVRVRDVVLLAVLAAAAGPCKMIYAPMLGLCLLIPVKKFGGRKKWLASAAAVAAAYGAAMIMVNGSVVMYYAAASAETAVTSGGESGFSLSLLVHRPGLLISLFYNTLVHQLDEFHLSMIGAWLGNLDPVLNVPYLLILFYTAGLLLLAFRVPGESIRLTGGRRVWIFVICAACGAAALLSMLIACTPINSQVIEGVQGRYFLPFLPVLLMACKNDRLVLTKDGNRSILYLMCCADLYVVLRIFSVVCLRL